jgi:hypothetical protein
MLIVLGSLSIALYGLILFYDLTKDELAGRRPLAKFLSIKLIVMFTFYQSFVVCRAPSARPFFHLTGCIGEGQCAEGKSHSRDGVLDGHECG